jgi:putative PIN family toxin of toxin-antitoxin system
MNTGRNNAVKAVIDTNVYISAVLFRGNSGKIIEAGRDGRIELLVSQHIITEIADILKRYGNIRAGFF